MNGTSGWLVSGKGDYSNMSVFFPATGYANISSLGFGTEAYIWSSSLDWDNTYYASGIFFKDKYVVYKYSRCFGFPIRPVRSAAE